MGQTAHCPALLISAPASGQGKTTVVAALARLLTRQGWRVQVFKCGPDFLDGQWHTLASGQAVDNVDGWIHGEADIRARLHHAALHNDVLLIEGVMGLYDGQPSSADLARLLNLPVLCVIAAQAMAASFGALAYGLAHYPHQQAGPLRWAGVLANRVGSPRHAQMLADSLPQTQQFWGAVPNQTAWRLPERHLGLHLPSATADALAQLDGCADALAATPLGQLNLAQWQQHFSVAFAPPAAAAPAPDLSGQRIAIARDAALGFIYPANEDALRRWGAQLCYFSPLADEALPPCDALWLPGGYPELHAPRLQAAERSRRSVAAHIAAGKPVWAEGGGMLLLGEGVVQTDGHFSPLWALLPGRAHMQTRLAGLGSQAWAQPAGTLRGHSFHRSTWASPLPVLGHCRYADAARSEAGELGEAIYAHGAVRASYFHPYFPSAPQVVATLFGPPQQSL